MVSFEQDQLSQMRLVRTMVAVACLEWLERDAAHLIPDGFTFGLEADNTAVRAWSRGGYESLR